MSLDTEAIRERLAKATPGPWCMHMIPGGDSIDGPDGTLDPTGEIIPACDSEDDCTIAKHVYDGDADLIINAPTDIAALLSEVDRLTAENEALRSDLARAKSLLDDARRQCDQLAECLQRHDCLNFPY